MTTIETRNYAEDAVVAAFAVLDGPALWIDCDGRWGLVSVDAMPALVAHREKVTAEAAKRVEKESRQVSEMRAAYPDAVETDGGWWAEDNCPRCRDSFRRRLQDPRWGVEPTGVTPCATCMADLRSKKSGQYRPSGGSGYGMNAED